MVLSPLSHLLVRICSKQLLRNPLQSQLTVWFGKAPDAPTPTSARTMASVCLGNFLSEKIDLLEQIHRLTNNL